MPRAVADYNEVTRIELKTCPDGYVDLKRLTYGQVVERRAMMKMRFTGGNRNDFHGELAMLDRAVTLFDFRHCIVDHNLTDLSDRRLNLASESDLNALDPRIGQEIEFHINEMNNFDDVTLQENLTDGAKQL